MNIEWRGKYLLVLRDLFRRLLRTQELEQFEINLSVPQDFSEHAIMLLFGRTMQNMLIRSLPGLDFFDIPPLRKEYTRALD